MNDRSNAPHPVLGKILRPRRLALLASVAGLSLAVLAIGPGSWRSLDLPAWTVAAHAAEIAQPPGGFADLVSKVKPAVISVRVKIDADGSDMAVSQRDGGGADPSSLPFDQFFSRQFGFGGPNGMPHRHEVITGEGSGFFISPDGYAVTNNHVVDHAKSVQVTADDGTIYKARVIGTDPKTDLC
jgi:serine protease Do